MRTKQQNMKKKLDTRLRRCQLMMSFLSLVTIISLAFASIFSFSNANAVTFESEQGVAFTFNPTVTISITGGTGATNDGLTITNLTPGDVKDSNIITVSASANTPLGYSLSSTVGSSTYNTTELRKDGTSTANKFTNLSTNKASLSNFDDNTWGYSYSTDSGSTWISGDITSTTNTGYNGLPIYTTSSPIKLINSSTAGSSSIQFKIGAKASTSQIAGTYNNVINFIGTGKVVTTTYTINYNDPSGEADPTTIPATQQGTESQGTGAVQISSTVPVRTDYMFKGWCTSQTSDDTCSSDVVQPGGYVALNPGTSSATANVTRNLYAMWKNNSPTPPAPGLCTDASTCMQTMTIANCPTTPTAVIDGRDGNTYNVAKLADDNCWMVSNLKLGKGNGEIITLDSTDSDLPSGTTFDLKASGMGSSPDATGDCNVGDWYPSSTKQYLDVSHLCINTTTLSYGTYYNWYTAVAGTAGYDTTSGEAPGSICPAGWHLPPNAGNGSYYNLLFTKMGLSSDAASSTIMQQPPTSFLLSGYTYGEGLSSQGSYGLYWSSTAFNTTDAYSLYFTSSSIYPQLNDNKGSGSSVRCVLSS